MNEREERPRHCRLDLSRELRCGFEEVVLGAGKDTAHLIEIIGLLLKERGRVLVTRLLDQQQEALRAAYPQLVFNELGKVAHSAFQLPESRARIAVVSAGTSDLRTAEEAAVTAEYFGIEVLRLADVGVAGLHRLLDVVPLVDSCDVAVVVAGMEGALPTVLAGLTAVPVIAVPTSVGYGAALGGFTALFAMLLSCSPGLTVVNIDNGFGAALAAAKFIRHLRREERGADPTLAQKTNRRSA